jgi:hemolysin III
MFKFVPDHIPEDVAHDIKTIKEELANMISHGLGIFIFLLLSPLLLYSAFNTGNFWYLTGCAIFCTTLLMVYISSTLYHSMYNDSRRKKMRILDHISIYFLIAGSYTPFIFTHFKDYRGWTILGVLWIMTLLGSIFKLFFTHKYRILSTVAYVVMGWMALFIFKPLMLAVSPTCFQWIVIGGAFYTIGVIFYLWERLYHNHFIWHLFVLGGSVSHFLAVYFCVR